MPSKKKGPAVKPKKTVHVEIKVELDLDLEDIAQVEEVLEAARGYGSAEVVDMDVRTE